MNTATIITGAQNIHDFESLYLKVRSIEGRLLSDEEVARLPECPAGNQYRKEWKIRSRSCSRLKRYISRKKKPMNILEAGCGNGWFSHQLASIPNAEVRGQDINVVELEQGRRIFNDRPNLSFTCRRLEELNPGSFDLVLFAASIQYFKDPLDVLGISLHLLRPGGEIHIIDSPFYKGQELKEARKRSAEYYEQLGMPGMKDFYFHHSMDALAHFKFHQIPDRLSVFYSLIGLKNPFPWIRINKQP
jgi:ubiquinone/menaquinone biosynthesis C-methylase UbiE